jgi:hypothetical protein
MNRTSNKISKLYGELKRRKVLNTAVFYILTCWVILQVGDVAFPIFEIEQGHFHWILGVFVVLFPLALTISWFYNFSSVGFIRVSPFVERRTLENMAPRIDRRDSSSAENMSQISSDGWFIYAETGPVEGLEYHISKGVIIGRAIECDITLLRSYISRNHAYLQVQGECLIIEDLGSSNGTQVNGELIKGKQALQNGDEIRFKDVSFTIREYASTISNESMLAKTAVLKHF